MNHLNNNNGDDYAAAPPANIADDVVVENDNAVVAAAAVDDAAAANNNSDADDAAVANEDDEDAVVTNLNPAEAEQICTEALTLLQKRLNLPSRLRDRTMVRFAQQFLNSAKEEDVEAATVDTVAPAFPAHAAAAAGANEDEDENEDDVVVAANNNDDGAAANNNIDDDEDDPDDDDVAMEVDNDGNIVVDVATLDILDPDVRDRICNEAIAILRERLNFPSQQRDRTIVQFAQQFLTNVKDDIHKILTDTRRDEEGYDGLDSERDTEEEVETAIRCGPEVLTRVDDRFGLYPIRCLMFMQGDNKWVCNVKAVSFVPLFAKLAIEFNSFEENTRGGLLIPAYNGKTVLYYLVSAYDENHHQRDDSLFLAVLMRLRHTHLFTKDDIRRYNLVHELCWSKHFSEQRFRYLIGGDPSSLITNSSITQDYASLPLHWVTDDLQAFQIILDSLFRYYPRWRGINALFQMNNRGKSSFALACDKFRLTRTKTMEVVEGILARYTTDGLIDHDNALIVAAIDDNITLDGLYFLIRRQPDRMLSMRKMNSNDDDGRDTNKRPPPRNNNTRRIVRAKRPCNFITIPSLKQSSASLHAEPFP